ncbi:uncharacterized protein DS421_17g578360 [Arachis hypogaea]|nr:uncharacterized protein DS421_17g578360 [Arachis hypogaea]
MVVHLLLRFVVAARASCSFCVLCLCLCVAARALPPVSGLRHPPLQPPISHLRPPPPSSIALPGTSLHLRTTAPPPACVFLCRSQNLRPCQPQTLRLPLFILLRR